MDPAQSHSTMAKYRVVPGTISSGKLSNYLTTVTTSKIPKFQLNLIMLMERGFVS